MSVDHRALLERFVRAINEHDHAAIEAVFTEDLVEEYPQSGEVVHGGRNFRAIIEHYPSGLPDNSIDAPTLKVQATDDIRVVAPLFAIVRVEGAGNEGTYTLRSAYPDGTTWWTIGFYQLRDGRIARSTVYFAPEFDAPEWRAPYVERTRPPKR